MTASSPTSPTCTSPALTQLWKKHLAPAAGPAIHPSAVIDPDAVVDPTARIGPLCVIERGARIGADTVLKQRVSVGENCVIGERCLIHPGVVIGADGFGFAPDSDGAWEKIEQLGAVRIGNDVEIGANTCIDRGALQDTVIEDGVKLDNLIQIGHNVHIGKHTAMAGCAAVAGSATIGAYCTDRRPRRHPGAPDHRRPRHYFRDVAGDALHPQARPLHRHLSHRRQCGLGKERGLAQAAAQVARTAQGPGKRGAT